jgi:hypothetical protein
MRSFLYEARFLSAKAITPNAAQSGGCFVPGQARGGLARE